jgi:hypothetical protein
MERTRGSVELSVDVENTPPTRLAKGLRTT